MSKVVLKVNNVSKQYRLGQLGTGTISHDLNRWWYKIRGKEDPYLKVGDVNDRAAKGGSDYVWSLKDINFEVHQGDVLGIIGKNGAGKSTLLKILSQVTTPTTGKVKIRGRIAALLEVGTGFHSDLTGRENIFLNGAILGMTKQEIQRKFDEIVDFSGVEKYIDTPVKRYSSGMMVRLGFAVAAHLEPEILIVDEVLAVGDAEFQEKCMGKMKNVAGEGRTVLFVSHNISAIRTLCTTGLLLDKGQIVATGDIKTVTAKYEEKSRTGNVFTIGKMGKDEKIIVDEVKVTNQNNATDLMFHFGDDIIAELHLTCTEDIEKPHFQIHLGQVGYGFFTCASNLMDGFSPDGLKKGKNIVRLTFKRAPLLPNQYELRLAIRDRSGAHPLTESKNIATFTCASVLSEIGFNSVMSDVYAHETLPPSIEYSWDFNNTGARDFKIGDHIKK